MISNKKSKTKMFEKNKSGKLGTTGGSIPFPPGMAVVLKASSKPMRKDAAEYSGQLHVGFRPRSRAAVPAPAA